MMFISFIILLQRWWPIEPRCSQILYCKHMLGYTKWDYWYSTITKGVHGEGRLVVLASCSWDVSLLFPPFKCPLTPRRAFDSCEGVVIFQMISIKYRSTFLWVKVDDPYGNNVPIGPGTYFCLHTKIATVEYVLCFLMFFFFSSKSIQKRESSDNFH